LWLLAILAACGNLARAQTVLPAAEVFCNLSQDKEFSRLSNYHNHSLNKRVLPPDNTAPFSKDADECPFLERAAKMFLWLTSPDGHGSRVFLSPDYFYDAWSNDSNIRILGRSGTKRPDFVERNFKNLDVKIDIDPGQVDGTVLMTQDCRIVYYLLQVNDVYAYFLTGIKSGKIKATEFPTSKSDVDAIENVSGKHFDDRQTLTVELKSAWIEINEKEAANYSGYITTRRTIPVYKPENPPRCSPTANITRLTNAQNQQRDALLALIGMHVVFSASGHPEMLWATFEHVNNTPNAGYGYFDTNGKMQPNKPDLVIGKWMFSDGNPNVTPNVPRVSLERKSGDIVANQNKTIGPSDILRKAPWGVPEVANNDQSAPINTKIIFINEQIINRLPKTDPTSNYIMIGTMYTITRGSGNKDSSQGGDPDDAAHFEKRGSCQPVNAATEACQLVNTTMETFYNFNGSGDGVSNCFDCHHGPNMLGGAIMQGDLCKRIGLSHLFGVLPPLGANRRQKTCKPVP